MHRLVLASLSVVLMSCGSSQGASSGRTGLDWGEGPPSRPGSSITHTQMCECRVCDDSSCCEGADEDQAQCEEADVSATFEGDEAVVDFSGGDSCGIEVRSCEGQCRMEVWRVALNENCQSGRPEECCG